MKKTIFLVGAIAVFGFGAFLVSCSKDDNGTGICSCKTTLGGIEVAKIDLSSTDDNPWGAKSCSDLTKHIEDDLGMSGLLTCK